MICIMFLTLTAAVLLGLAAARCIAWVMRTATCLTAEVFHVPHCHGQYQVAKFDTIVHEGEHWEGKRGVISLYLMVMTKSRSARTGTK